MKKRSSLVKITTVPSRFIQEGLPEFPVDYERLIAVSSPAGNLICKGGDLLTGEVSGLVVTRKFSRRLTNFVGRWLVPRDPEVDKNALAANASYICHSFALEMKTGKEQTLGSSIAGITRLRPQATPMEDVHRPLPFGTQAIIIDGKNGGVLHSSIAIGMAPDGAPNGARDPADHLQVMDGGGHIGITSLPEMVDYYTTVRERMPQVFTV